MKESKRILFISRTMGQGGAEKVVFQLVTSLQSEFEFIGIASTGGELSDLLKKDIPQIYLYDIQSKNPIKILWNIKMLTKFINDNEIDTIHTHHRMAATYGRILKRKFKNLNLIYTAHNSFFDKKILYKNSLKDTNVIAVGKSVKENLLNDVKVNNSQISVIPNSVRIMSLEKITDMSPFPLDENIKIICSARLSEQKGIAYLIKAFSIVNEIHSNARLYLIGDGEDREKLEQLTKNYSLKNIVIFLGYKKNILNYIKHSDFVVLPSLWEGFPLTPIETFMMKKTIIATDIPGTNEIVNNKNGILVPMKDEKKLAEAIIFMIENVSDRKAKEQLAIKTYEKNFSYELFIEKHKKIYFNKKN